MALTAILVEPCMERKTCDERISWKLTRLGSVTLKMVDWWPGRNIFSLSSDMGRLKLFL